METEEHPKDETNQIRIEIHFYKTPYLTLIKNKDWRGVLLKAHINWLGQELTHCGVRIITDELDVLYTATWFSVTAFRFETFRYPPCKVIDVTHKVDCVDVLDNIGKLFKKHRNDRVTLGNLLHLMFKKPEEVDGIICTSFTGWCLGLNAGGQLLYPDNFYSFIVRYFYETTDGVSIMR